MVVEPVAPLVGFDDAAPVAGFVVVADELLLDVDPAVGAAPPEDPAGVGAVPVAGRVVIGVGGSGKGFAKMPATS